MTGFARNGLSASAQRGRPTRPMPLFVLGINHRTAPIEVRERVAFDPAGMPAALRALVNLPDVDEGLIVSTCNRTELYCAGQQDGAQTALSWLREQHALDEPTLESFYRKNEQSAVRHTFEVACGLDSMVLGEPQILGQVKDAFRAADEAGALGPVLNRLFQQAFSVAKLVRTDTGLGASAVSVASAAVSLAGRIFANFDRHTALFIGAGETIALAARHLHGRGLSRMIVANRSIERARLLAREFNGYAVSLDEIEAHLAEADIVISSTASPHPILTASMVKAALRARKRRPMFIVDLAVPRDVEPQVQDLQDAYLYTVDDIEEVTSHNMRLREEAAKQASTIVESEVSRFERNLRMLDVGPLIKELRAHAGEISEQALSNAQRQLAAGNDPQAVLTTLANALTNKLLHQPTTRLREAGAEHDEHILQAARELFALRDPE